MARELVFSHFSLSWLCLESNRWPQFLCQIHSWFKTCLFLGHLRFGALKRREGQNHQQVTDRKTGMTCGSQGPSLKIWPWPQTTSISWWQIVMFVFQFHWSRLPARFALPRFYLRDKERGRWTWHSMICLGPSPCIGMVPIGIWIFFFTWVYIQISILCLH